MLVLRRKSKESVVIAATGEASELLRVTVVEVRGGTVKLGFQADPTVAVHREEIWERVRSENMAAPAKPPAERPRERVPYMD